MVCIQKVFLRADYKISTRQDLRIVRKERIRALMEFYQKRPALPGQLSQTTTGLHSYIPTPPIRC